MDRQVSHRQQLAEDLFRSGYSCSQAILAAFGAEFGLARETALRLGAGLGGGVGRQGEVCGAVSGAAIVIGLRHGNTDSADTGAKEQTRSLVQEFCRRFAGEFGAITCRELIGCDIGDPRQYEEARRRGLFRERCPRLVSRAAAILEDVL